MFDCINPVRKNKIYPQEEIIELFKKICPVRDKSIKVDKPYVPPNKIKCQTCYQYIQLKEEIRISKVWNRI